MPHPDPARTMNGLGTVGRNIARDAVLVFCAALIARALTIGIIGQGTFPSPEFDEFYHLLAARSWASDGSLRIADGEYQGSYLYTIALGWMFLIFGESELVARLPNIFIGSLTVVAVFSWTYCVAGRFAAWVTALLFGLSPIALYMSGFIRFYAPHGLAFWLGAIGWYALLNRPTNLFATGAILSGTIVALLLAAHLQITTYIGVAGLMVWSAVVLVPKLIRRAIAQPSFKWVPVILAALFLLFAVTFFLSDLPNRVYDAFREAPVWNAANKDNVIFYHYLLLDQYPTFWPLLPLAVFIALARKSGPALFCATIFSVAILIHSLAGQKWDRYIYYILPFLYILWGIVIAEVAPHVLKIVSTGVKQFDQILLFRLGHRLNTVAAWAGVSAVVVFAIASNSAFPDALKIMLGSSVAARGPSHPWTPAREKLQPWLDSADVVLTTNGLRSLYYFDRYDIEVNVSTIDEADTGTEFGLDDRTGRLSISTVASVQRVLACFSSGLFLSETYRWRNMTTGISDGAANVLEAQTRIIPMPKNLGLLALYWEHTVDTSADCSFRNRIVGPP